MDAFGESLESDFVPPEGVHAVGKFHESDQLATHLATLRENLSDKADDLAVANGRARRIVELEGQLYGLNPTAYSAVSGARPRPRPPRAAEKTQESRTAYLERHGPSSGAHGVPADRARREASSTAARGGEAIPDKVVVKLWSRCGKQGCHGGMQTTYAADMKAQAAEMRREKARVAGRAASGQPPERSLDGLVSSGTLSRTFGRPVSNMSDVIVRDDNAGALVGETTARRKGKPKAKPKSKAARGSKTAKRSKSATARPR